MAENKKDTKEALGALYLLADAVGVDLKENRISVATPEHNAIARTYNGSLEANLSVWGRVEIDSSQRVGMLVEEVALISDPFAPPGAIFRISAYIPREGYITPLNADVVDVYISREGIILSDKAVQRKKRK